MTENAPQYECRATQFTVARKGDQIYSESATRIDIDDEGAGEFIALVRDGMRITIDPEEWPVIRDAIDTLAGSLR